MGRAEFRSFTFLRTSRRASGLKSAKRAVGNVMRGERGGHLRRSGEGERRNFSVVRLKGGGDSIQEASSEGIVLGVESLTMYLFKGSCTNRTNKNSDLLLRRRLVRIEVELYGGRVGLALRMGETIRADARAMACGSGGWGNESY